jgi:hypothetical protein
VFVLTSVETHGVHEHRTIISKRSPDPTTPTPVSVVRRGDIFSEAAAVYSRTLGH